jgi:hypothetical protein
MQENDKSAGPGQTDLDRTMNMLRALLEAERDALMKADAGTVTEISIEKERLASAIARDLGTLDGEREERTRLAETARRLGILAEENHVLLKQMYLHFRGVTNLLGKLVGIGPTYERDGRVAFRHEATSGGRELRRGGV